MPDRILPDNQLSTDKTFLAEVNAALRQPQKHLPSKYFYDSRGCFLFEQICELPEYYLTRTELAIMQQHAAAMARQMGPNCLLIEYGSGAGTKTRILLDHLPNLNAYVPVDIAGEHLQQTTDELSRCYPDLEVLPVTADFSKPFIVPQPARQASRHLIYFPGSTIGNFGPTACRKLLQNMAAECGSGGGLLIGLDLQKDPAIIEPAYNDAAGVTAQFNYNLLERINRQLDANFNIDQFQHHAWYNRQACRIEMLLISQSDQTVSIGDSEFSFAAEESICTEYSYKFDLDQFCSLAGEAGFRHQTTWTDKQRWFAVLLFELD